MKYVIIGAGSRGLIYGKLAREQGITIAAIAEKRPDRLENAARELDVPEDMCFSDAEALLAREKLADAAIIATQDRDHYAHAMKAMERGYHILLEKPISASPRECLSIPNRAFWTGRKVTVCHVLRYTPFWSTIKGILDSGELGKIVAIKHSENIGDFHMAHSFVRGNWRNSSSSGPIILTKSCHDLDLLLWLTDAHCTKVSAFGDISQFWIARAPEGSTDRCCTCPLAESCRYEAKKMYLPVLGRWPADVVCLEQTEEALTEALRTGPYGRCVYRCDNNVCDHMSVIMEFDSGVTATFSLTGQTSTCHRNIHIMCQHGEILADDETNEITVRHHISSQAQPVSQRVIRVQTDGTGHGGGDWGVVHAFAESLKETGTPTLTGINTSTESHLMAFAIEESRRTGRVIRMEEYKETILEEMEFRV